MRDPVADAIIAAAVHGVRRDVEAQLREELPRLKVLVSVDPEHWDMGDRLLVRAALHYLLGRLEDHTDALG